ncbi:hypothetical protein EDD18DRAFT_1113775 [Armillaria luteobubalina]|uniref:Uncharacterized protein n=1 Tax=Armillaria luteobubalina TaxID=153913 RepID=A0AA39PAH6_9AGAR|nr:hypothetical protein EDD18DRAFT_1113775 [Armillaria luteobubalina]
MIVVSNNEVVGKDIHISSCDLSMPENTYAEQRRTAEIETYLGPKFLTTASVSAVTSIKAGDVPSGEIALLGGYQLRTTTSYNFWIVKPFLTPTTVYRMPNVESAHVITRTKMAAGPSYSCGHQFKFPRNPKANTKAVHRWLREALAPVELLPLFRPDHWAAVFNTTSDVIYGASVTSTENITWHLLRMYDAAGQAKLQCSGFWRVSYTPVLGSMFASMLPVRFLIDPPMDRVFL